MDWITVAMWIFGLAFGVVFVVMWTAGEKLGEVSGIISSRFLSDQTARIIVKRIAPSGSRRQPMVVLQVRVFMGANGLRLTAPEAKRMADALDKMIDGMDPGGAQFRGIRIVRLPGEVGVITDIGADNNERTIALEYADARALGKLLRTAAAT